MTVKIKYIIFDSNEVELKIAEKSLQVEQAYICNRNRSGSGKIEYIGQHAIQIITFASYFKADIERKLQAWWAWARQGKEFSFSFTYLEKVLLEDESYFLLEDGTHLMLEDDYLPALITLDKKFRPEKTGSYYFWEFKFAEVL